MIDLELVSSGHARVVRSDGDRATLLASRAYPPGATLEGRAACGTVRMKVKGSRRVDRDEQLHYEVLGRWVNLTRTQREHLTLAPLP